MNLDTFGSYFPALTVRIRVKKRFLGVHRFVEFRICNFATESFFFIC
jgi:hypothetical protein